MITKIFIRKVRAMGANAFEVGPQISYGGNPKIGRGHTIKEALGDFLLVAQTELGIQDINIEPSAQPAENARLKRER